MGNLIVTYPLQMQRVDRTFGVFGWGLDNPGTQSEVFDIKIAGGVHDGLSVGSLGISGCDPSASSGTVTFPSTVADGIYSLWPTSGESIPEVGSVAVILQTGYVQPTLSITSPATYSSIGSQFTLDLTYSGAALGPATINVQSFETFSGAGQVQPWWNSCLPLTVNITAASGTLTLQITLTGSLKPSAPGGLADLTATIQCADGGVATAVSHVQVVGGVTGGGVPFPPGGPTAMIAPPSEDESIALISPVTASGTDATALASAELYLDGVLIQSWPALTGTTWTDTL